MSESVSITVVGSGYVGLVTAACFAEIGHRVLSVDNDDARVKMLNQGGMPIHEEFLPELLGRHRLSGRVRFTTDLRLAAQESEAVFIAVGTPQSEGGNADLSYVDAVAGEIARSIESYKVIVEKSTVPVYTNDWIRRILERNGVSRSLFDVASNPEFLREGTAVKDFLHPDRIVLGADSEEAARLLGAIYAPLISGRYYERPDAVPGSRSAAEPPPVLNTSAKAAELIKHASNAFLAMKISFINVVANLCEAVDADVEEVARGMGLDKRIGNRFLSAGIGYGGSCFPKDVAAFRYVAQELGIDFGLLGEVEKINENQKQRFFQKVRSALWTLRGKRLGVLGLAFKGGTDDIRESPAIEIIRMLREAGATIQAYDPAAMERASEVLPAGESMRYVEDPYAAADNADALLVLTDWAGFSRLDLPKLRYTLRYPIVIDGRNLYDPVQMRELGFTYLSVGRAGATYFFPCHLDEAMALERLETRQRILVTGAAGFLGSHLCDALLAEGHTVIGVDNLSTGRTANLAHLGNEPRFSLIERDICQPFDAGPIDFLFNFASPASPADYSRLGPETLEVGSSGTRNSLELARKHGAAFLHASTSECYGDPDVHPQPESYWGRVNPIGPRSVYDEAKRFSEALIMAYHRYHHVDTRMVRIFNTYGPRLQPTDGRVISNLMIQALLGEDLTIYGDGNQTRSFCYVSDLIAGILLLARSNERLPVNIGNPEEWTIGECAREILAVTGSASKVRYLPLPVDDPTQRCPDIAKAKTLLGWGPRIDLRSGLELSLGYFQEAAFSS